jgi:hypothetical protein
MVLAKYFLRLTTLTVGFPCFFLSCKANARVKFAKTGHGPHSSTLFVIWVVRLLFVLFCVLFVCKCILPSDDNPTAVNKYINKPCIPKESRWSRWLFETNTCRISVHGLTFKPTCYVNFTVTAWWTSNFTKETASQNWHFFTPWRFERFYLHKITMADRRLSWDCRQKPLTICRTDFIMAIVMK